MGGEHLALIIHTKRPRAVGTPDIVGFLRILQKREDRGGEDEEFLTNARSARHDRPARPGRGCRQPLGLLLELLALVTKRVVHRRAPH